MLQSKDIEIKMDKKNKIHLYVVCKTPILDLRKPQIESEGMENHPPCYWKSKET